MPASLDYTDVVINTCRGANRWALVRAPLAHVGCGVAIGAALTLALARLVDGDVSARAAAIAVAYGVTMMGVCMLACIVPTRRALRVDPIEALKEGG